MCGRNSLLFNWKKRNESGLTNSELGGPRGVQKDKGKKGSPLLDFPEPGNTAQIGFHILTSAAVVWDSTHPPIDHLARIY